MSDIENAAAEVEGEQEAVSAEDALGSIFDEIESRDESGDESTSDRPRDEQGRFAKKTDEEDEPAETAAEESAEGEATEITADHGEDEGDEAAAVQALDAPASWSATAKASWPSLSPELQNEILKRETDWQRADGERANRLKGFEPIDAALEPVRQHLNLHGVEPAQYVRQLVAADQFLRTQPQQAIQWIAQQYGIDFSAMHRQAEEAENLDPSIAPIVQEVNALKSYIQRQEHERQQAEATRLQMEIGNFAKDKPYYEDVRADMAALLGGGRATDLQTAYDMAIWANPATRAKIQAESTATTEKKRQEEAAAKAAKAKRVAQTNLSSRGTAGGSTPDQFANREDELNALYDRVQGAA